MSIHEAAIKERPILFSGPMVRAILDGRKTQTRRIVKAPAWSDGMENIEIDCDWQPLFICRETGCQSVAPCPYGQPGERLWVRETWCPLRESDYEAAKRSIKLPKDGKGVVPSYRADHINPAGDAYPLEWRPSIFMPRWASRLTLEIIDVRVQRLNEISEEDAKAEGVDAGCLTCGESCVNHGGCGYCRPAYRDSFVHLWGQINGTGSWDANPWVWAITFKRVEAEQ